MGITIIDQIEIILKGLIYFGFLYNLYFLFVNQVTLNKLRRIDLRQQNRTNILT